MMHIESDFSIEQINPLAQREANAKRPIYMLHKWWARRLGCVFRTIVLSSLIPDEEWQRLDDIARKQGVTAWHWLYYRECHKGNVNADHTGHGCAIELIDRYCKDKVILDPFMGGGTTVVEALRLGCKVIGLDVNPVAWFIVKKSIEPVDLQKLDAAFKDLEATVAPEILKWYHTVCPRGHKADVMYIFWVRAVRCLSCGQRTRLFNSFRLASKNGQDAVVCPQCYGVQWMKEGIQDVACMDCRHTFDSRKGFASGGSFICEHCGTEDKTVDWVRRTGKAPDYEMFAIEYWCQTCYDEARQKGYRHQQSQAMARGYKGADDFDRKLYRDACREFDKLKHTLLLPEGDVYEGMKTSELLNHGLRRWQDLFNPRQLLCLGKLMQAILGIEDRSVQELLVMTVSDCTRSNNLLCAYENVGKYRELAPLFVFHAYRIPNPAIENNPWGTEFGRGTFDAYLDKMHRAIEWLLAPEEQTDNGKVVLRDSPMTTVTREVTAVLKGNARCALFARTSEDLSFLPDKSVDMVITDPPYCLAPGTLIVTERGYVPIEEVKVGERVLSHLGRWTKVTRRYERHYKGEIIRLKVAHCSEALCITPEHPVYAIQTAACPYHYSFCRPGCAWLQQQGHYKCQRFHRYQPQWIRAGELRQNDVIAFPTLRESKPLGEVRLSKFLNPEHYCKANGWLYYNKVTTQTLEARREMPQYDVRDRVTVDADLLKLLGYFVAEGHAQLRHDRGEVNFTFSVKEKEYMDEVKRLMRCCFGLQAGADTDNRPRNNQSVRVNFYSKPVAEFFRSQFYTPDGHKRLPDWLFHPSQEFLWAFVQGYWIGDGHKQCFDYRAKTASPNLAGQMRVLLQRLAVVSRVHFDRKPRESIVNGKPVRGKGSFHVLVSGKSLLEMAGNIGHPADASATRRRLGQHGFWLDRDYWLPIRQVERVPYEGMVYNLETEDQSYTTICGCVHNCGNVQYAELSDFFYVWLCQGLARDYSEFRPSVVPKEREIIVNERAGKAMEDYLQGLARAFRECHRALNDDGLIVFTFHHEAPKAWGAVLDAVLQASFDIRRVWTYHSETRQGAHGGGIRFDTIIVARKRSKEASEASWQRLQDEIAAEVQAELKRLLQNESMLGMEDVFVVTMGKALAVYSRHYPKVMREGKAVKLEQAIEDIEGLVNEQIDAYWGLIVPNWLDVVSRIYLQTLAHRETVSRDQLVKMSTYAGVEFGELEAQQLMRRSKKAGVYEVLTPLQRKEYLENQHKDGEPLTPIDCAHWLYITYKEGRSLREAIPQVVGTSISANQLEEVLAALAKITRDKTYERLQQEVERLKGQMLLS